MRNAKWIAAAVLSVVMLLGIVGPFSLVKKPATSSADFGSKAVEAPEDIWAPYEETVSITTIGEENSGTSFQGDDDYQNNPWYQAYKDRFNIELHNKWISNDYGTKLNLAIADGDLADVFYVDSSRLTTLYKAGLIMNLDDVFERYASDTLKGYWEDNKDTWETGCFDDSLYGIPQMNMVSLTSSSISGSARTGCRNAGLMLPRRWMMSLRLLRPSPRSMAATP